MSMRIRLGRFLLQLGDFIQSLPVLVMKPDDLVEFSRQAYAKPGDVESWAEDSLVDTGLSAEELDLLNAVPLKTGELLVLGVGGGREAIPMARIGFRVTGVDFVPAMVERAKDNATRRGVELEGIVQEISQLDLPGKLYDVVWMSRAMYSSVPTRKRRVEMVRRIARVLKPGGYFLCQFHWAPQPRYSRAGRLLRRLVALITLGNLAYEEGDILWLKVEFIHAFATQESIRSELEAGGLCVLRMQTSANSTRGNAVCQKNLDPGQNP
ncbi:MAG: class I SAM-dependent methyltransferase [Anaerolineales bacterium]|nr:class I SAM-dependent methyltransferase [Anaerolineales bacterium]